MAHLKKTDKKRQNLPELKDQKHTIGLTIIILPFLVSLNPYLLFLLFLFFLTVLVFYGLVRQKLKKTLWTVLPVTFWYPSFHVFMYLTGTIGTATAQKIDFHFPDNFKGKAIVVERVDCGKEIVKKDGREQLSFPENGILLYQGKIESGYINHQYVYLTKTSDRIKISTRANYMFWNDAKTVTSSSEVDVWLEGMGMARQFPPEGLSDYEYLETIVSSKDSLEKYYAFQYNKQIDSIKHETMKRWR